VDRDVAREIALSAPAAEEPMLADATNGDTPGVELVPDALIDEYFADVQDLRPPGAPCRELTIAYTPLHGVGYAPVRRALTEAGFSRVFAVASQREPDGSFPTVAFPNPEEPGALDRVTELAREVDADIVIANDPDVDRLAASLKMPSGDWVSLSGNQIGVLLADFELERAPKSPRPLVAQSIVSSPMLASIAAAHAAAFEQTLTGFKWIWTAALDLMRSSDVRYAFGYEEALGYCAGHLVRDKDGISAALLLCELAALEKSRGSSLRQRLERLYRQHGLWVSVQKSAVRPGLSGSREIQDAMERLGVAPPDQLGDRKVTGTRDFRTGGEGRPRWLENTSLVELSLGDSGRVLVRPSGTEPKLKVYVDLCTRLAEGEDVWQAESVARRRAADVASAMLDRLGLS
jgi:phosphomannomutase